MNILGKIKCIVQFACFYFLKVATRKFEVTYVAHFMFLLDNAAVTGTPSDQLFRALF